MTLWIGAGDNVVILLMIDDDDWLMMMIDDDDGAWRRLVSSLFFSSGWLLCDITCPTSLVFVLSYDLNSWGEVSVWAFLQMHSSLYLRFHGLHLWSVINHSPRTFPIQEFACSQALIKYPEVASICEFYQRSSVLNSLWFYQGCISRWFVWSWVIRYPRIHLTQSMAAQEQ